MKINSKAFSCAAVVLAAAVILSACRADFNETTAAGNANETMTAGTTGQNAPHDQTKYTPDESKTGTTAAATEKEKSTRTETTTGTTAAQPSYEEWTYRSIPIGLNTKGNLVTYTENPKNDYIAAAARQLSIPANRLSATFYSEGATIFTFSSYKKSKATLTDCYIMYSGKMKIEENIRKDGAKSGNKALADLLYDNAMKHKP